ncbi:MULTISPECIES: hypothetical protein [Photorhabdus]|uniref:Uncharacterized protein n=1 Tax=Photorhabdus kayaii TaxID=230088 RepID=A0ABX0B3R7_9GAMM|nr:MULTISPECIES: hypothetical protein [Photorhabdus]MCC8375569.1 hypothetical protein [Photorhabdus bodei]MCC8464994.1 hypothetical protein [Photorhabdus bodei]MCT8352986.1 hypothetical protein [Photorhabdus kayaii]MDB6368656.1 hypothetical protein [Photorhabdus bodei]NDL14273.1 hypothetical protein [Photorhabdus kayaii]
MTTDYVTVTVRFIPREVGNTKEANDQCHSRTVYPREYNTGNSSLAI